MSNGPKRPCLEQGCNILIDYPNTYCDKHKPVRKPDTDRPSAHQRGYNGEWRRYRLDYLAKHPLCVQCLSVGLIREATVVDHIKPHKGDKQLFWDRSNHQALCKRCHDMKTARKDGGFGRKINKK